MPPTTSSTEPQSNPPSLSYLVIYNPTLKPDPANASHGDDDDEIERAHILFYTARERAVSKDIMLRQVGLAKALTNFSEMFALDPCESIHSQRKRLVLLQPEPDFWIVASVDVPRSMKAANAPSSSKDKSKPKPTKSDDKGKAKAGTATDPWDYHENAVFDDILRTYLQRGYLEFKLLHGSFSSLLSSSSRAALEASLEKFFTPWAWKWDVEVLSMTGAIPSESLDEGSDFASYLGVPVHPAVSFATKPDEMTPILEKIYDLVPPDSAPFVLSLHPRSLFPFRSTPPFPPPTLPRYLLNVIPPPPSLQHTTRRASAASLHSTATLRSRQKSRQTASRKSTLTQESAIPRVSSMSFIPPLPKVNLGLGNVAAGVTNPKKWGWPSYFTFGRSGESSEASSRTSSPARPQQEKTTDEPPKEPSTLADNDKPDPSPEQPTPLGATVDAAGEASSDDPTPSTTSPQPPAVTAAVNQTLLLEAIDSEPGKTIGQDGASTSNAESQCTCVPPPTESTIGDPVVNEVHDGGLRTPDSKTPKPPTKSFADTTTEDEASILSTATSTSNSRPASPSSFSSLQPNTSAEPQQELSSFSSLRVHVDSTPKGGDSDSNEAKGDETQVSYLLHGRLVFAFIHKQITTVEERTSLLDGLKDLAHSALEQLEQALEREYLRRENKLTGRPHTPDLLQPSASTATPNTRHVICAVDQELTSISVGYQPTSPHFFAARQLLSWQPSLTEVFSRAGSGKWFAAKRRVDANSGMTDSSKREVYAEIGKKDASLVDVDHEVDSIVWKL